VNSKVKDLLAKNMPSITILGTFAMLVNTGVMNRLNIIVFEQFTFNQLIFLVGLFAYTGYLLSLIIGSKMSIEEAVQTFDVFAKEAFNASDTEWARQKDYAKDKIKSKVFGERAADVAVIETQSKVLPTPKELLKRTMQIVGNIRVVMAIDQQVEVSLSVVEGIPFNDSDYTETSNKAQTAVIIICGIVLAAIALWEMVA
jgi:hypothetical protein